MQTELDSKVIEINDDHLNIYANHCKTIDDIIKTEGQEKAFFVCDLNDIVERCKLWKLVMPRVTPHYAVKCNDYIMVLEVIAAMGFGFDCASTSEIHKVLSIGVEPSRIIYANTTKPFSHIQYAANANVDLVTFDNEIELTKLQKMFPNVRAVIRIRYDSESTVSLGSKFGCDPDTEAPRLLQKAKSLGINVVGVSFHVGYCCRQPSAFYHGIKTARRVFESASALGYNFTLLDIGGGFTTRHNHSIFEYGKYINAAIEEYFPDDQIAIISEPGTYFVETAFTLACYVHSKKVIEDNGLQSIMYYVNEGVFGSFAICLLLEELRVPQPLKKRPHSKIYPSIVWGITMSSIDVIVANILLPEMNIGDWVVFSDMGDYTMPLSTTFNGFEVPDIYDVINKDNCEILRNTHSFKLEDFTKGNKAQNFLLLSKRERYGSSCKHG